MLNLLNRLQEMLKLDREAIMRQRDIKFRNIGSYQEGVEVDARRKRSMKKRDAPLEEIIKSLPHPTEHHLDSSTMLEKINAVVHRSSLD